MKMVEAGTICLIFALNGSMLQIGIETGTGFGVDHDYDVDTDFDGNGAAIVSGRQAASVVVAR